MTQPDLRKLARAIHFDESDRNVFSSPARTGEWCVSGGFEFSDWTDGDLTGKARQAFANGWLGLETFGRVTFVAVTQVEPSEIATLTDMLAQHFVTYYGAPDVAAARPVAAEELTDAGVRESFRVIQPQDAGLEQFAIHGDLPE